MNINSSWDKTMDILHRGMSTQNMRFDVISNNLANADTPNFKRSDVNFESSLKRALDTENYTEELPAKMTSDKHIPFFRSTDYQTVMPRRHLDYLTKSDNNGNNVDVEEETNLALKTQMTYTMLATAMNGQFNNINLVLRG